MKNVRQITQFGRIVSALGGEAKLTYAKDSKNTRLDGFKLAPRYGFANVAVKPGTPSDPFQALGLGIVTNTAGLTEGISIENRNGDIRAYAMNLTTFVRTEIQNNGVDVELEDGNWSVVGWGDVAYLINGDGTKTVYKHTIGDSDDLTVVQDSSYTSPSIDPEASIVKSALGVIPFDVGTDTFAYTVDNTITSPVEAQVSSGFSVTGNANDNGPASPMGVTVEVTFAATKNFTGSDYIALVIEVGDQFDDIKNDNYTPQLKIGGSWVDVTDFKAMQSSTSGSLTLAMYIKGMTINAIQGVRFRVTTTHVAYRDSTARVAFTVSGVYLGGVFLEASSGAKRIWDDYGDANGVKLGVRFRDVTGAFLSQIYEATITSDESLGFYPSAYSCPLGARIYISSVNAPSGAYDRVEILRLTESGADWKVIGTATAAPFTKADPYCEYELSGLSTALSSSGGTPPEAEPPFRTTGIGFAFAFKNSMVWLVQTGESNIQVSRVGDPEELYDVEASGDYSDNDLTVPAQLTMADNNSDVPVWGCQVGHMGVVIGSASAYTFAGDFPPQLKACREIPGSRGIAGVYAGVRFRPVSGQYAAAYADEDLNIWLVGGYPQFEGDASIKPVELSEAVRGLIRSWLYTEQLAEFPTLNVNQAQVAFDDVTSSLWVILGRRAMVYRQGTPNDGWDKYEYQLTVPPGSEEVSFCTEFSSNMMGASSVAPGDAAWSNVGFAFASDDSRAESAALGYGTTRSTETLRVTGFVPDSPVPVSAVLDNFYAQIERKKTGELVNTEIDVKPTAGGAPLGSDLSTAYLLTLSDVTEVFSFGTLPTVAQVNAGDVGLDLKYTQETWDATNWNNPANWTITVSGGGTSASMVVTATYIGPGSPPTKAFVDITSTVVASIFSSGYAVPYTITGNATIDNGQGESGTDSVSRSEVVSVPPVIGNYTETSTVKTVITLTAGTGSTTITRSGSGTITSNVGGSLSPTVAIAYTGSAAHAIPTDSAVQVDSVKFRYCATVTYASDGVDSGVSFERVAFVGGLNLAVRNSGQMDVIERYLGNYIEGNGRDGGYAMPDAYFISQDMGFEGFYGQISQCQLHAYGAADDVQVAFSGDDGSFVVGTAITVKPRWRRFPVSLVGVRFNAKIMFGEDVHFVSGISMEYNRKSRGRNGV